MVHKKLSKTAIWVIVILIVLVLMVAVYLLTQFYTSSNKTIVFSGNALANPVLDGSGDNPLSECSAADHRECSRQRGDYCRTTYGGNYNAYCLRSYSDRIECDCIKNVV